jgi:hypothetical protein
LCNPFSHRFDPGPPAYIGWREWRDALNASAGPGDFLIP